MGIGMADADKNKMVAKEYLLASDKYLKSGMFDKARQEIDKAKQNDPSNPYIPAFEERLRLFEQTHAKQNAPAGVSSTPPAPRPAPPVPEIGKRTEIPMPPLTPPPIKSVPVPRHEPAASSGKEEMLTSTIGEMRQQLEALSRALEHERKAREEIVNQQLESAVRQLRVALERAWQFGAPKTEEAEEIHRLARTLNVSSEIETSVTREVKLMMYSKAVKEVIAKRKLLRSSSSTLEWLRKIYQISINEYLEYESHFLMELVTSQFRGTMLFISPNVKIREELVPRFKETGFAVASAVSAEEALEKVERLNPTVVLCDTMAEQGGLSGFKFLHFWRTRSKYGTIPFILLCEPHEESQLQASELKEVEGYISKTCEFDEINALVNEKLHRVREYIGTLT